MAGLLDDFKMPGMDTPQGQGLLAAAFNLMSAKGPSLSNALGQAGGQYMGVYNEAKQSASANEMQRLKIDAYKRQVDDEKAMRDLALRHAIPAQAATQWKAAIPVGNALGNPNAFSTASSNAEIPAAAGSEAVPAGFDREGYGRALEAINPTAGFNYLAGIQKDNSPVTLKPGEVAFDKYTHKPLFSAPKEFNTPAEQQGYELAQKQGYGGSFMDYQTALKKAGATNVSLSNVGPKAFEAELGKMDAEQLGKWRDSAMTAQNTLSTVKKLEDADAKGAYSGGAANLKMTVGSYINGITGATPKGQIGSELYNAEAGKLVLDQIKTLGANPSNADREFIQKTVPQLSTNPEARRQMTKFMSEKAQQSINLYNRANTHARKNSGLGGFQVVEPTGEWSITPVGQ